MGSSLFTMDQTWLQCIHCGHKADLLKERKFRCPICNGLYDVQHNFLPMMLNCTHFQTLFDNRASKSTQFSDDPRIFSGVWRFYQWIMPYLPIKHIISLGEGNVPIVPAGRHLMDWIGGDIELYIILEGMGPTGSFKDFGGTVMMTIAKAMKIQAIACASTGDTSAMASAYSTRAGIRSAVILPEGKVTAAQLAQPLVHGATIITIPSDFDACMKIMEHLVNHYGVFPANSLNPTRIEGHQATVFLIAQHFHWKLPDWIVAPVGNGSNVSSIGKALRLMKFFGFIADSRILGCQSMAANPMARSWDSIIPGLADTEEEYIKFWMEQYKPVKCGETTATAARIGNPVSRDKVMREICASNGAMQIASEKDLNEAVAVCGKDGIFVCPQTGTGLAGLRNAVKCRSIKKGEKVVVVSTATGLKFTESAAAHLQDNIIHAKNCKADTVAKIMGL